MLLWFVDAEVAIRAIDGVLIGETSVEVDPANLCSGVVDENINLEAVHHFFQMLMGSTVLSAGAVIHINIALLIYYNGLLFCS